MSNITTINSYLVKIKNKEDLMQFKSLCKNRGSFFYFKDGDDIPEYIIIKLIEFENKYHVVVRRRFIFDDVKGLEKVKSFEDVKAKILSFKILKAL